MGVAGAAAGIGAAGAAASAYGSYSEGHYSAQVAKNNATAARQNAAYTTQAGYQQAQTESLKNAAVQGRLRSAFAANGVDTNTGSAVDVQSGEAAAGQLDTSNVQHNALLQAYGYQTEANSDEAQATQDQDAGEIGAASDLLSSASSLGFKYNGSTGSPAPGVGDSMGNDGTDASVVAHQGG